MKPLALRFLSRRRLWSVPIGFLLVFAFFSTAFGALGVVARETHLAGVNGAEPTSDTTAPTVPSASDSAEDGWPDLSRFMDKPYGFVPVVIPITEPAVGYGAAALLAFIDKRQDERVAGFGRPNITAAGGLVTANGTSGVLAGDTRHWLDDRLQTLVGLGYASINLDFYGIGDDRALRNQPLDYSLEPLGGVARAKYRLGHSCWWTGLGYSLATTRVAFDAPSGTPGLPPFERDSQVGGVTPMLNYDSRDNFFTPASGTFAEAAAGVFSEALGGDAEFQRVGLIAMRYVPLHQKLTLGLRGDVNLSFGDVPFYLRPFVFFRGVQAMRYQGEHVIQAEAELRWQFWKRLSLVGFVGGGTAWNEFNRYENSRNLVAGGTGFRYELARKYGLHMGFDVAFGPDEPIFYVQFGSAWLRP
ncbi:MAG: BamA/TamA family outer membrane protein [Verrucomicrobia bacterium]|nr:BamA/TamA family outer membrane protein [Verrucomicrobiota bacterium]